MSFDATLKFRRLFTGLPRAFDNFGEQALFYGETFRYVPNAVTRYRRETIRLVAEMTMGSGALVMIGGTVGVATFLTLASGGVVAAVPATPYPDERYQTKMMWWNRRDFVNYAEPEQVAKILMETQQLTQSFYRQSGIEAPLAGRA